MRNTVLTLAALFSATACGLVDEIEEAARGLAPGDCTHDPAAYAADPDADGPWNVGFRSFEHTYTPPAGEPRTITVNLWYPTDAVDDPDVRYLGFWPDPSAIEDAPPAAPKDGCKYPVIAYSHGHLGWGGTGAHFMRRMASQGWIGVAPDHTGNTIKDNLDPRPTALYIWRPSDVSASLDALAGLDDDQPLAGRAETNRVLLVGHSFGSYSVWGAIGAAYAVTTIEARCEDPDDLPEGCSAAELAAFADGFGDPRIVGAITSGGSIRPDWFGEDGDDTVTIPLLDMTGTEDGAYAGTLDRWPTLAGHDLLLLTLAGGCHSSFETGPIPCDTLDLALGHRLINAYTSAFAQRVVLGRADPAVDELLDGGRSLDDAAEVERR